MWSYAVEDVISEKDNDDFIVIDNAVSTAYDMPCTVAVPINEHKFEEALDNHETVENIDTAKKPIQ